MAIICSDAYYYRLSGFGKRASAVKLDPSPKKPDRPRMNLAHKKAVHTIPHQFILKDDVYL